MALLFTKQEIDDKIAAAVAKATKPLLERIAELEAELAQAKKDSSNSSKPPSSDIVKPKKPKGKKHSGKRKQGAQPGHPKHERSDFPPEMLDAAWEYHLDQCPVCGDALLPGDKAPRTIQQIEIVAQPVRIDEHRGLAYWCNSCQKMHYAPLPPEVQKGGLFGPQLTALVAYMKGVCHASFSTIRKFLRDVVIAKATQRVPSSKEATNMAKRFRERGPAYFEFITTPNVEPTNNLAEQAIRFVVIDRRITQGTRSESGRRWCERIWTVLATCDRTSRDVLEFLFQSLLAHWSGEPPPSLVEPAPA